MCKVGSQVVGAEEDKQQSMAALLCTLSSSELEADFPLDSFTAKDVPFLLTPNIMYALSHLFLCQIFYCRIYLDIVM